MDVITLALAKASVNQSGGGNISIDNTLTKSGYAADAKKVGDEISDLKDDFDKIFKDKK